MEGGIGGEKAPVVPVVQEGKKVIVRFDHTEKGGVHGIRAAELTGCGVKFRGVDQKVSLPGKKKDQVQLGQGVGIGKDPQVDHAVFRVCRIDPFAVVAEAGGGAGEKKDLLFVFQKAQPVHLVGKGIVISPRPGGGHGGLDPDLPEVLAAGKGIVGHGGERVEKCQRGERSVFEGVKAHFPESRRKDQAGAGDAGKGPFSYGGDGMPVYICRKDQFLRLSAEARDPGSASRQKGIVEQGGIRKGPPVGIKIQSFVFRDLYAAPQADLSSFPAWGRVPSAQKGRPVLHDQGNAFLILCLPRVLQKAIGRACQGVDPEVGGGISPFQDGLRSLPLLFPAQVVADDIRVFLCQDLYGPGIAHAWKGQEDLPLRVSFEKGSLIVAARDLPAIQGGDPDPDVSSGGKIEYRLAGYKAFSLLQDHPDSAAFRSGRPCAAGEGKNPAQKAEGDKDPRAHGGYPLSLKTAP